MGKTPIHVSGSITPFSSNDDIHRCLLAIAEGGNQTSPIAARFQTRPERIDALVGAASEAARTAQGGSAYNFHSRPFQYSRPRSLRLGSLETAAATEELNRLTHQCRAVEIAPEHDGDKALLNTAPAWERTPLRLGPWPRERRIPVFSQHVRVKRYNHRCLTEQRRRRAAGLAFRDFESTVFTVPKKDGAFRLCTDYRRLNVFQRKTTFKMDDVQLIAELIQPGDFGMMVDLKDAYLTLGLHPSHRKYCRFRNPETGQRLQWRTVSFGSYSIGKEHGSGTRSAPASSRPKSQNVEMFFSPLSTFSMPRVRLGHASDADVCTDKAVKRNTPYGATFAAFDNANIGVY